MKRSSVFRAVRHRILGLAQKMLYQTPYFSGDTGKFESGRRVGLANTLINLEGGSVTVGDYTIFGHNVDSHRSA